MITKELITYIKNERASGTPRGAIERALKENGWSDRDIMEGFSSSLPPIPPAKRPSHKGRKFAFSALFVLATAIYAGWNSLEANGDDDGPHTVALKTKDPSTSTPSSVTASVSPAASEPLAKNTSTPTRTTPVASKPRTTPAPEPTPTPAPAILPPPPVAPPKPKGLYNDGTYTGVTADAYYGLVRVEAIIQDGKLADVRFLDYPNDRRTSIEINSQAMPLLINEALQSQNANVDIVSGATDTSEAFVQSLSSALTQAKA